MSGSDRGGPVGVVAAAAWWAAASVAEPPLRAMLAWRVRHGREIAARLPERRGIELAPRPAGRLLWMHAASVGETISILPVLHALAGTKQLTLLLTTGTVTSATIAAERLPQGALHRFAPLDVPRWIGRFANHWRPDLACFVESEIWPNTLAACAARHIPTVLLNARLSERSFAQWRRARPLARRLFGGFGVIQARSDADAARLGRLAGWHVGSPGDLKFAAPALPADPQALAALRTALAGCPVWVAASLHPGEDAIAIQVHARLCQLHPGLVTILVPRHPKRGAAMAAASPMGVRSAGVLPAPGLVYLADTLGELGVWYRLAACALIGGSLVAHGGQNPLEAARLGLPVAIGPHAGNFAQATEALRGAGALTDVTDAATVAAWVHRMLSDPAARDAAGQAGRTVAQRWTELPDHIAGTLIGLLPAAC